MYNLYLVKRSHMSFIGVAKSMEQARECWGEQSDIEPIPDEQTVLELRLQETERVFLAT